jgi:hypothetical protein
MRRKSERQRFKSGHTVCASEYRRFPHVYDYESTHPSRVVDNPSANLDSRRVESALAGQQPLSMFWCDQKGRGWYWEAPDLGEHRLFDRAGKMVARLNERGGAFVLTWPRTIPQQSASTEEEAKRLALNMALAALDIGKGQRSRRRTARGATVPAEAA